MESEKSFYQKLLILLFGIMFPFIHVCHVGAVTINEYNVPTSDSLPVGITSGSDGALWFTENSANKIGRIDPTTHTITEYSIPTPNSGVGEGITSGPDGALWFTEGGLGDTNDGANQIGRIDPTTHVISEYIIPTPGSGPAHITSGPDGALWFTEQFANQIGRIDPTTHVITEYTTPSSDPWGITSGPDGALWFNECAENYIARIDPTTHFITEYPGNGICGNITTGPDGALWFITHHNDQYPQVGRFDLSTKVVTEFPVPTANSNPVTITSGPDGALWFNELYVNKIGRIDPTTHAITELVIPTSDSFPVGMTSGSDGRLWFTEAFGNNIGSITLKSSSAILPSILLLLH